MRIYNLSVVYSPDGEAVLTCLRSKKPYLGLYNFPGGKAEPGEEGYSAAYRELFEETGISRDDIKLTLLMEFSYPLEGCKVEAYAGRLKHNVSLKEEAHKLFWHDISRDFFDMNVYAGEGNMGHMLEIIKQYPEVLS